jgi:hypothetical protein
MKTASNKPTPRHRLEPSLASVRSAVSNGSTILPDIDHRSAWMRRLRDLINDHVSDLGGLDAISSAEMVLIRRSAMLALQCELQEHHWAENDGEASLKQLDAYQRTTGALRRTLESLGLRRRPHDITPDPLEYAKQYDRRAEDAQEVVK